MKIEISHVQALRIAQLEASLAQANFAAVVAKLSFQYGKDLSICNIQPDGTVIDGTVLDGNMDGSSTDHAVGSNRDSSIEKV